MRKKIRKEFHRLFLINVSENPLEIADIRLFSLNLQASDAATGGVL